MFEAVSSAVILALLASSVSAQVTPAPGEPAWRRLEYPDGTTITTTLSADRRDTITTTKHPDGSTSTTSVRNNEPLPDSKIRVDQMDAHKTAEPLQKHWEEVSHLINSGFASGGGDCREGSHTVSLPIGYELFSYTANSESQNGDVKWEFNGIGKDNVTVKYRVCSEGSWIDRRRGWLSLRVVLRGFKYASD